MVSVNAGGLAEGVFESEMFGHVKGSFTGATTDRIGRFELANEGTLFLDEIANINPNQQARLLRVLAPLGVLLPNGLGLNIDGTDMGRVAFVRCLPNGCVAEVVMDDALLKQLSDGSTAIFVVFKTPEEGIGIPVSLNGFKDGFANLP